MLCGRPSLGFLLLYLRYHRSSPTKTTVYSARPFVPSCHSSSAFDRETKNETTTGDPHSMLTLTALGFFGEALGILHAFHWGYMDQFYWYYRKHEQRKRDACTISQGHRSRFVATTYPTDDTLAERFSKIFLQMNYRNSQLFDATIKATYLVSTRNMICSLGRWSTTIVRIAVPP